MLGLPEGIRGCLFDLDGVLTRTAEVHRTAWAEVFNAVLVELGPTPVQPFTESDYLKYVDGKPRRDGVRDFLASRGIHLPEGEPDDPPTANTIAGVGNRKNELLLRRLQSDGVKVYEGSRKYLDAVKAAGLKTAVVTASANSKAVLDAANLSGMFDVVVDGNVAAKRQLAGKPAPDTFQAAAEELGLEAAEATVFEDALAGVEAGKAGRFGFVVGVDRANQAAALKEHGASIVVQDLAELLERP
jgi:beta-phosphoglucomutase family hydrolase